jgi:hypothetical protein
MHTFLILQLYHIRLFILLLLIAQVEIVYNIHQNFFINTDLNLAPK